MPRKAVQRPSRFAQSRSQLDAFAQVASQFGAWRPAPQVLTDVRAVPTIFPQYDVATRIMGHPTSRFCLVRGESNHGKTVFGVGLLKSFLMRGHFAGLADAERTTPPDFLRSLMGDYLEHPGFSAMPISTYEATVDGVREYCERIAEARAKRQIPEETTGIILLDSIRKLVPKSLLAELLKKGTKDKGVDGFGGRAGQIKAALNAAWVDELIPLLADTQMSMAVIARETDDPNANFFEDPKKVGGGKALIYDSSLDCRVSRSFIVDKSDKKKMYGERHRVEIRKTKVAYKETKYPFGYFHTSNGTISPAGFDLARDVLEMACQYGVVTQKGNSYIHDGQSLGVGELKALETLRASEDLLHGIEQQSRSTASAEW